MKAYELPVKVTPEGELELPETLLALLPRDQIIRVIILIPEPTDSKEQDAWARLTAEQFLAGYSEADSIYDTI
jgi:hypothetical protein